MNEFLPSHTALSINGFSIEYLIEMVSQTSQLLKQQLGQHQYSEGQEPEEVAKNRAKQEKAAKVLKTLFRMIELEQDK